MRSRVHLVASVCACMYVCMYNVYVAKKLASCFVNLKISR